MSDEKFDAIVVGAGPGGTAAALVMAKAGLNVVLLERGEYPGAKNVQGAVLYTKMLDEIVPGFWLEPTPPVERHITEQKVWVLSEDSGLQIGFKSERWNKTPHNCYTIIRTHFDKWFAKKAEEAGAQLYTGVTVREVLKKDGKIVGIKTSEGDEIHADVVVAADGVNSMLAQQAGLMDEWKAEEVALGVKEVLAMPRGMLEDRFCLEKDEGTTNELFGAVSLGMLGYGFLYTNKESLSIGVGVKVSHLQKSKVKPYDLLEYVKQHPIIRKMIEGSKPLEYSAHLIPEGGYHSMPPLFADGFLIVGDAAQMINPSHREGSNFAMAAGRMAAETVILAKRAGDFSKKSLSQFQKKLQDSFVLPDLYLHRDLEITAEKYMALLNDGPELMTQTALDYFNVDGRPKRDMQKSIVMRVLRNKTVRDLIKSEMTVGNFFHMAKMGLSAGFKFRKLFKAKEG